MNGTVNPVPVLPIWQYFAPPGRFYAWWAISWKRRVVSVKIGSLAPVPVENGSLRPATSLKSLAITGAADKMMEDIVVCPGLENKTPMPIKTVCQCGFAFNAKDALAGKRVKCPKCQSALTVPSGAATAVAAAASGSAAPASGVNKKLLDLLDDAGVRATPKGPVCAACGEEMEPTAVICINCGYNVATGQYLETFTDDNYREEQRQGSGSDAEKRLAKAEREIEDMPIGAEDQDFGDGADSYIIAMIGMAIFVVLLLLGLGTVLIMEALTDDISPALISSIASGGIYLGCAIYITTVGFRGNAIHGVVCALTAGLYCMVFGFIQGKGTIAIAIVMIVSFVVGGGSLLYYMNGG